MKIHNIQQGSPEWFELRVGKITGGASKSMIGAKWLELCDRIAAEQETGYSDDQFDMFESEDMIRGKDLEPIARSEYERVRAVKVEQIGFVQPDNIEYFGFSPDGFVKGESGYIGAIEIKSPRPKKHLTYIRQGKIPTEHEGQIIAAFLCFDQLQWVDFITYCPEIERCKMYIIRADRELWQNVIDEYQAAMIKCGKQIEKIRQKLETINQPEF
jgi:hypothetical protein